MLHAKKAIFLFLPLVLLLTGCFEKDSQERRSYHNKGVPGMVMADESFAAAPRAVGNMAIDRSKLGNKRIAEQHRFKIDVAQEFIRARLQADFNRCLKMKCEILDSRSGKTSARLAVRIVPEDLPTFLTALQNGEGEIISHNVSVDDRTMAYIDTEAKLKNQIALRERLTKLLNSDAARNVNELLRIERELSRVQSQIDSSTGRMRHLQNETAKVCVNVSYNVPFYARDIDYKDLKGSFFNAWRGFVGSVSEVIEFLGESLPWIPVLLIGLWLFIKTLKVAIFSSARKLRNKKAKKEAKT